MKHLFQSLEKLLKLALKSHDCSNFIRHLNDEGVEKTCGFEVQPKFVVFVPVFTAPSGGRHAQLNTTHSPQWHFCLPGLSAK